MNARTSGLRVCRWLDLTIQAPAGRQLGDLSVMVVVDAVVVRQAAQFATVGANVLQNENSKERKLGTIVTGNESSRRQLLLPGTLVPGIKSAEERKVSNSFSVLLF